MTIYGYVFYTHEIQLQPVGICIDFNVILFVFPENVLPQNSRTSWNDQEASSESHFQRFCHVRPGTDPGV